MISHLGKSIFRFLASIRFAIPILAAYALAMIVGTAVESRHGAELAARLVYNSLWFYAIQAGICVSLLFAVIARIPLRKRLVGFYIVHFSLISIIAGAAVTKLRGIDGSLELREGTEGRFVQMQDDLLYLWSDQQEMRLHLPSDVNPSDLNERIEASDGAVIRVNRFIPYARRETRWEKGGDLWWSRWMITSERFAETIEVADRAIASMGLEASVQIGPVTFRALPIVEFRSFRPSAAKEDRLGVRLARGDDGRVWVSFQAGASVETKEWTGQPIELPWMGFKLVRLAERFGERPVSTYSSRWPKGKDSASTRAIELVINDGASSENRIWVDNQAPIEFKAGGRIYRALVSKRYVELPWPVALEKFRMDFVPGTESPMSYESTVAVPGHTGAVAIGMNRPLKLEGFTLYQASYSEDQDGRFRSTLSVNKDPGRWIKYVSSIALVIGLILHYLVIHGHLFTRAQDPKRVAVREKGALA